MQHCMYPDSLFLNLYIHISNLYFVMFDLFSFNMMTVFDILKVCHIQIFNPTLKWHALSSILRALFHILFWGKHFNTIRLFMKIKTLYFNIFSFNFIFKYIIQCIWLSLLWLPITMLIFVRFLLNVTCRADAWWNKEYVYTQSMKNTFFLCLESRS